MELCDDGHEQVCFESRLCPLCEFIDKLKEARKIIDQLENEIDELKIEISKIEEANYD